MNWRRDGFMPPGSDEGNYRVPGPTPEQARQADHPETIGDLQLLVQKYRKLHNLCKRFINKNRITCWTQVKYNVPEDQLRTLLEDICECIGYDP